MESDLLMEYQKHAAEIISRNKSVLDILTKLQCANARVSRSVIKAVTGCGCVEVDGRKNLPESRSQLLGELCEDCRQAVTAQLGEAMFYAASLCTALGLSFSQVVREDMDRCVMMGRYTLR